MADIKFLIGDQADLSEVTKTDGQFLISKDTNQLNAYVDYDDDGTVVRQQIGGREVELTQAQYNALSTAEKNNGTTYYIIDAVDPASGIIQAEVSGTELIFQTELSVDGTALVLS